MLSTQLFPATSAVAFPAIVIKRVLRKYHEKKLSIAIMCMGAEKKKYIYIFQAVLEK